MTYRAVSCDQHKSFITVLYIAGEQCKLPSSTPSVTTGIKHSNVAQGVVTTCTVFTVFEIPQGYSNRTV